jgi:hypothetical protein
MHDLYIWEDGRAIPTDDLALWGAQFQSPDRIVEQTQVSEGVKVSTVFLGMDHSFCGIGPPVLWETMIFGGPHDQDQRRYTSREDAIAGHAEMVALARSTPHPPERSPA